jgi:lipopolysaccharide/colanic/teichoic acid biosynthesis glycosyltransferase
MSRRQPLAVNPVATPKVVLRKAFTTKAPGTLARGAAALRTSAVRLVRWHVRGTPPLPSPKRCLDVALAAIALVLLSPVLGAVALAVRLGSPGPVLFRQERLGLGGQPFVMLKFRTMYAGGSDAAHRAYVTRLLTEESPATGGAAPLFKLQGDCRVTPIGRWLRRTSLDELPQLFNVLRGEMSLVGPRPALAWEAQLYRGDEHRRFDVLPGITGLWQVSGRNRLSMRQALALDVEYVRRQSLWFDLVILVRTIPALVRREAM